MRSFFIRQYNKIAVSLWIIIILLYWIQYVDYASLREATLLTVCIFVPTFVFTFYLSNYILPETIRKEKMKTFFFWFLFFSIIMSIMYPVIFLILSISEYMGILSLSQIVLRNDSFITGVRSVMIVNLGFCGLRFCYEHMRLQEVFTKTQLKMLHSQVNPHFMFNILNHIYILMRRDIDLASSLLLKFSEMLRYQFYEGEKDSVPLSLEIKFLQDMIEVERMRRGSELNVISIWDTQNGSICIPPLLLVTFVENAFKHVSCSISEKGYVKIEVRQRGGTIYMQVENSKSRLGTQKSNAGNSKLEIRNIKENLDVLYPNSYSLAIDDTEAMHIVRLAIEIA